MASYEETIAHPVIVQTRPRLRYAFKRMAIGDWFAVPLQEEAQLRAAAAYANGRGRLKVTARKAADRVWCGRVA